MVVFNVRRFVRVHEKGFEFPKYSVSDYKTEQAEGGENEKKISIAR